MMEITPGATCPEAGTEKPVEPREQARTSLVTMLHTYQEGGTFLPGDATQERQMVNAFVGFVQTTPDCLERTSPVGHFTGSAMVVDVNMRRVLLTHHAKLGLWIQLGGHADGAYPLHEVAMQEAHEESGLAGLFLLDLPARPGSPAETPLPFDLDVHTIPAHGDVASHLHYDVRFLVCAPVPGPLIISHESRDLQWLDLDQARRLTTETSMHRQFDKVDWLRASLHA